MVAEVDSDDPLKSLIRQRQADGEDTDSSDREIEAEVPGFHGLCPVLTDFSFDEEGFRKACEFVLLHSPTGGNLEAEVKRRDLIQDTRVGTNYAQIYIINRRKTTAATTASGPYCSCCSILSTTDDDDDDHDDDYDNSTVTSDFAVRSDGVPAAGKTKTKYERSKFDHYFYERGNAAVEVEMPLGKRMYPILKR
ncbi:hypothetical protein AK812_SmicGene20673 [Symbiodinium microadriaticum]|uniref:Uncharacterized protein n=1 Tax=Symbiodinium microadriaticum TaxID=2951 RepID=A0A1Q9DPG1_SYMMI|nr:hypothetical protein AK812_SmicGene20673 [Symbiodinium microadriaticum]